MIPKQALERYLNREMASFAWLKKLPREELFGVLEDVNAHHTIDLDSMWTNQLAMLAAGIYMPEFLFLVDMGAGKTRVVLELINYHKARGEKNRWLICVLDKANIENWLDEIQKFGKNLTYIILDEDKKTNKLLLEAPETDLYLIHYPGLVALCADLKEDKKKGRKKRQIRKPMLRKMQRKFTGLALDEISEVGNPKSKRAQICYHIGKFATYKYGLTGTPFGRDPTPIWNEFRVIDSGETLGNKGLFKAVFFRKTFNGFGYDYKFKKKMKKDLHRIIANRSITYTEGECQDLPERIHIKKIVTLPDYMEEYYKNELTKMRRAKGDFREIKASFLRMRQVASGFLGLKNDETGEKAEIEFPENPKVEKLIQILHELPVDAKALIYHEYIWTGDRIARELKAHKFKFERLHGGQKDPRGALRKFKDDPEVRFLVINNKSGAFGLNLQAAAYEIFVESPVRPIVRQQAERRVRRSGQQSERVFIIDLIARSKAANHSVDDRILDWIAEGKNLLDAVLKGKTRL